MWALLLKCCEPLLCLGADAHEGAPVGEFVHEGEKIGLQEIRERSLCLANCEGTLRADLCAQLGYCGFELILRQYARYETDLCCGGRRYALSRQRER
jgi:hypothetical protein